MLRSETVYPKTHNSQNESQYSIDLHLQTLYLNKTFICTSHSSSPPPSIPQIRISTKTHFTNSIALANATLTSTQQHKGKRIQMISLSGYSKNGEIKPKWNLRFLRNQGTEMEELRPNQLNFGYITLKQKVGHEQNSPFLLPKLGDDESRVSDWPCRVF